MRREQRDVKKQNPKIANIHAGCVALGKKGVLILGESGAGKSDLMLRLMDEGAKLVADDRTELYVARGRFCARAPKSIAGLIEVRGLGIIAQPFVTGVGVALAVRLGTPERLPERQFFQPPPGISPAKAVPLIVLDGRAASATARLRLALKAYARDMFHQTFNDKANSPK